MFQLPTPLWGPPPPWATFMQQNPSYFNNWQQPRPGSYPWPQQQQQQQQTQPTTSAAVTQQASHQSLTLSVPPTPSLPMAAYNDLSDTASSNGPLAKADQVNDPLVNALPVSSVPSINGQPYLSLHISNSIKKQIWVGQFIDLAYLLETQMVPEDSKSYEFACFNSSNPNRLSLTASKPKGKTDSYSHGIRLSGFILK